MALKTTNKNRKKEPVKTTVQDYIDSLPKTKKEPIHSWWWFHNNPKFYLVGAAVVALVLLVL
jgi:hypothetical protein